MKKFFYLLTLSGCLIFFDSSAQIFSLAKDIRVGDQSSLPFLLTDVNGVLYLAANDGIHSIELWKSDGTETGTRMVKDIVPGENRTGDPFYLTNANGILYFRAYDPGNGYELWKSDGTETGTVMVKDINATATMNSNPLYLTNINGLLYCRATDGINGYELWKSDGTEAGTQMVKDIAAGIADSNPAGLAVINNVAYFSATDGVNGYELWKSDGTEAGTQMIKDIAQGAADSSPSYLTTANGVLYFRADDGVHGAELWKSDGTGAGTVMVKDITNVPAGSSNFLEMSGINGVLYLSVDNGTNGTELWKSNGMQSGTVMVKDINSGTDGSNPNSFTGFDGLLYFRANDGIHGVELWKSDGTEGGTIMIKDIVPSNDVIGPVTKIGSFLYFMADDGIHEREAWRSDGTADGTALLQDLLNPGAGDPNFFTASGSKIFASFNGAGTGRELWVGNIPPALPLRLLEFKGQLVNDNVVLRWKTSNEENTLSFEIERSGNGINYAVVGSVTAANMPGIHQYHFTDNNIGSLNAPMVYYRLKQKDIDGKFTYSKIVALPIDNIREIFLLYPNPVIEKANLTITVNNPEQLQVRLINSAGIVVKQQQLNLMTGSTFLPIDVKSLVKGLYYLNLKGNSIDKKLKFIKQ